jgi:trimeric autotransporter adhesin
LEARTRPAEYQALFSNTTGIANNASGLNALVNNTTGSFNTANGRQAFVNNTTGLANTGIGLNALFSTPQTTSTPPSGTEPMCLLGI